MAIEASQTLREGRQIYFAENGLPADGGYQDRWVVIKVGRVPVFAFPNTADRRRAVPFHDLHHVLTGYRTDLLGEAEIGAWELASDCSSSRAATVLNVQIFGFMLPRYRKRLFQAFLRGRGSRNLYQASHDDALLERRVGDLRRELGVDVPPGGPTAEDLRAWRRWAGLAMGTAWGPLIPMAAGVWWWLA